MEQQHAHIGQTSDDAGVDNSSHDVSDKSIIKKLKKRIYKVKKKLLLISTLIATQLFAKTIDFEMMDSNPNRISPNSSNEILSFNSSIKNSVHSIVNISAKRHLEEGVDNIPLQMFNDPFFKRFFGDQFGNQLKQNRIQRSLGSGVIISKDGYIVTNNHVIENAEEITVTIGDETTEYNAKLIGRDADSDIAVIKIDANIPLKPIKLADSNTTMALTKINSMVLSSKNKKKNRIRN